MFANVILVRYGTGVQQRLIEVEDSDSVSTFGRYEAYLEVTEVGSASEATARAQAALATMAQEQRDITAAVVPIEQWDLPYVYYVLGNSVTVPEEGDVLTSERVMSISITEDDESGVAAITLGLRQVVLDPSERLARAVRRGFVAKDILQELARKALP